MPHIALVTAAAARALRRGPRSAAGRRCMPLDAEVSIVDWDDACGRLVALRCRRAAFVLGLHRAHRRIPDLGRTRQSADPTAQSVRGRALEYRQALPGRTRPTPAWRSCRAVSSNRATTRRARLRSFLANHRRRRRDRGQASDRCRLARYPTACSGARPALPLAHMRQTARCQAQRAAAALSRPRRRGRRDRADPFRWRNSAMPSARARCCGAARRPTSELFAPEQIEAREADADERALARQVLERVAVRRPPGLRAHRPDPRRRRPTAAARTRADRAVTVLRACGAESAARFARCLLERCRSATAG